MVQINFSDFQKNVVKVIRELNAIFANTEDFPMLVFCYSDEYEFCSYNLELMFEDEDFDLAEFYKKIMQSRFVAFTESIDDPEQSHIKIVFLSRTDQDKMLLAYSVSEQGIRVLDKICWRKARRA